MGYDTYAFAALIEVGYKRAYMTVVVLRDRETNAFYLHEVLDETGISLLSQTKQKTTHPPYIQGRRKPEGMNHLLTIV